MTTLPQRILLSVVAVLVLVDCTWASVRHFNIEIASFALLGALALALVALGLFYDRVRKDANLSAMLFGTAFLCAFSPSLDILNYFLLTVAGPEIDTFLAHIDRALGFDWPSVMAYAANHPTANIVLKFAYQTSLAQIAVLVICLGWLSKPREIYGLCLALAVGGICAVAFWTLFPSFGAFAIYRLPPDLAARLNLSLDGQYGRQLVALLAHGPGRIAADQLRGLIGFPSFHSVMAILTIWYARGFRFLRWPAMLLNLLVLLSTPIQGGHHVIDIAAGVALAGASIAIADRILKLPIRMPRAAAGAAPEAVRA